MAPRIYSGNAAEWPDGVYKPHASDDAILTKSNGVLTYFSMDYFSVRWVKTSRVMIRDYVKVDDHVD